MELGTILRELRTAHGLSQTELARRLSQNGCTVSAKTPSKWEHGVSEPSVAQFLALCELYEIRDVLAVFCGQESGLDALNEVGRRRVKEYVRLLQGDAEFSASVPARAQPRLLRTIPLYDMPVSAGTGQVLDSSDYTLIEVDETVPTSATFAVRVSGDSMEPRFIDRQIVYVKPQKTLEAGEIGIFLLNGDAYCKQLAGGERPFLRSLNPAYAPIPVDEFAALRVLGKVVG